MPGKRLGMTLRGSRLKQLQARRQRQAPGQAFHLVLHDLFGLATRVGVSGNQQVFQDFLFARLDQRVVDLDSLHLTLGAELDHDHAAAGRALDFDAVELGLHLLHLRLQLRSLLHHAQKIGHYSSRSQLSPKPMSSGSGISGSAVAGGSGATSLPPRTPTISAPGNRSSTALTSGSARTPTSSSAFLTSATDFSVGAPGSREITTIQERPVHV